MDFVSVEEVMAILGAVLDKNSLVEVSNYTARYEVPEYISDEIISHFSNLNPKNYVCDIYIDMTVAELLGARVMKVGSDEAEDVMFDVQTDNPFYKLICEHLVCLAKVQT